MQTRMLRIDLDSQKFVIEYEVAKSLEEKLGGFGRAVYRFYEYMKNQSPIQDAFESRNLFRIDLGFLTGSSIMTARRTYFTSFSPLKTSKAGTPGMYYSASSGNFGPALASCNLNAVEITGQSEKPIYLVIQENEVKVMTADELIEKTTKEKIRHLSEKYGATAGYAVIGPSGEDGKVRFANIAISTHDQLSNGSPHMRFAGRGGLGAVLGKKNVLGIVVLRGSGKVEVGGKEINRKLIESSSTSKYHLHGTFWGNLENLQKLGIGIFNNFRRPNKGMLEGYASLSCESLKEKGLTIKNKGCAGCAIKCWKEILEKDGTILGKMDWEPSALLGTNLGIVDARKILDLINLGDDFGVDTISLGVAVGMEMEIQNKFGDFEFAKDLIRKIGKGEHLLSQGVARYGERNSVAAMHVKGMDLAAYPGNFNPGYAFAIAGPHMSMDTYNRAWYPQATNALEEWLENILRGPKIILYDMIGICKFAKASFEDIATLYENATGEKVTPDQLKNSAQATYFLARRIDANQGFTADDDVLPERCFEKWDSSVPDFLTKEFFEKLKQMVYQSFEKMDV